MDAKYIDYPAFFGAVEAQLYRRGLKLNDLLDIMKVSRATTWRWKRGRAVIPADTFYMLCYITELNPDVFVKPDADAMRFHEYINQQFPFRF